MGKGIRRTQLRVTEAMIQACMAGIRKGMTQRDMGIDLELPDNSMVLSASYHVALDRLTYGRTGPVRTAP